MANLMKEEYFKQLDMSSTLYIGNLSFYTTEDQIYELFKKADSQLFVFQSTAPRAHALAAVKYLNGTKLDNRLLRVDVDYGFEDGRQFGRGRSGGQVRDEFRTDFDADRGGYGKVISQQLAAQQLAMWQEVQAGASMGAGLLPGGNTIFFGQEQRLQQGQAGAVEPQQQGAAGADNAGASEHQQDEAAQVVINPRFRGRGLAGEEEEEDFEQQLQRKRPRLTMNTAQQTQQQQGSVEVAPLARDASAVAAMAESAPEEAASGSNEAVSDD
eukprot:gene13290-13420_t